MWTVLDACLVWVVVGFGGRKGRFLGVVGGGVGWDRG